MTEDRKWIEFPDGFYETNPFNYGMNQEESGKIWLRLLKYAVGTLGLLALSTASLIGIAIFSGGGWLKLTLLSLGAFLLVVVMLFILIALTTEVMPHLTSLPVQYATYTDPAEAENKARAEHQKALESLNEGISRGVGYGLYLRGFELELKRVHGMIVYAFGGSDLEREIIEVVREKIPVVAIADPNASLVTLGSPLNIPRIYCVVEHWKSVVADLIGSATVIFFEIDQLNAGLQWELQSAMELGKSDLSVVIINPSSPIH